MKFAGGTILAVGLGACVSAGPAPPTKEIYERSVELSGYSFRCSAPDGIWFGQRLKPLLPWLEAELGKDHVAGVRGGMKMNLDDTDFLSCPTREERLRARAKLRRLLKQLEARSKR